MKLSTPVLAGIAVLVLAVFGIGVFQYSSQTSALSREIVAQEQELQETQSSLAKAQRENEQLAQALQAERERNDEFQDQIDSISGTVGKLDKLSRTDPELLQKYSKVYFLNENYAPETLSPVPEKYRFQSDKVEEVHGGIIEHLENMLEAAEEDGIDLLVASSYRSFSRQGALKASYVVRYGSGANAFSAEQGYSEHQLGTAVDLTTKEVGGSFMGFDATEAYTWLQDNAYRYGFILSYPKDNGYYVYEPWHWRFVGRELARDLHKDDKSFYDLDQRELDPYLIDFFD